MLNNKLTKSQRELFCNLKAFLYTKVKNFTPIQDVNDMALILKTQDKILKCHNIEQVNYPTAKAIGLFLASSLHN